MFCDGDGTWHGGDEGYWGQWTTARSCQADSFICGLQTKVEPDLGHGWADNTAMNKVEFSCCKF